MLDAEPWIAHAFGTAIARPEGPWLELKQVHSALVLSCDEWRKEREADALVASQPGISIAVKSADCLPILLADPETHVIAAVHAGWRGCVAGVAIRTVEKLQALFGTRPETLLVAFGPSIRACCFEVQPDVGRQFSTWFPERKDLDGPTRIDLPEANRRQLVSAGLRVDRIASAAPCTLCYASCTMCQAGFTGDLANCTGVHAKPAARAYEFLSWRRDRRIGARMHSVISIKL